MCCTRFVACYTNCAEYRTTEQRAEGKNCLYLKYHASRYVGGFVGCKSATGKTVFNILLGCLSGL